MDPQIVQGLIVLTGFLLLVSPAVGRWIARTASDVVWAQSTRTDFEKRTVTELLDLKDRLEKQGQTDAGRICKDLVISVIYGQSKP